MSSSYSTKIFFAHGRLLCNTCVPWRLAKRHQNMQYGAVFQTSTTTLWKGGRGCTRSSTHVRRERRTPHSRSRSLAGSTSAVGATFESALSTCGVQQVTDNAERTFGSCTFLNITKKEGPCSQEQKSKSKVRSGERSDQNSRDHPSHPYPLKKEPAADPISRQTVDAYAQGDPLESFTSIRDV